MCCDECYLCGASWSGAVNTIAAIDLLMSAIHVTFETATLGMFAGIVVPLGSNTTFRANCTSNCTWLYEYVGDDFHFDFDTWTVTALILCIMIGFMVEGYLFSTLRRGANERIYKFCKKWFNYRCLLLLLVSVGSITKYLTGKYYLPIDGFLDIWKIYRVISMLIVRQFMVELANTVGMIYVKAPKKAKRGSLGLLYS